MSAAILQGVPATTLDTDLWIDLPPRQYMRVLRICQAQGGQVLANTVVELSDGSLVNFVFEVHGIASFNTEFRRAHKLQWLGTTVAVLPLERILKSKRHVGRPKDIAHLPLIEQTLQLQKRLHLR
jgi:acetolactate synthase regulatory subunit